MPLTPTSTEAQVAETSRSRTKSGECISVGEALKLFPLFKGNKCEVLAFIGKVDPTFSVISPNQEDMFFRLALQESPERQ
jgi:DUF1009 family protein